MIALLKQKAILFFAVCVLVSGNVMAAAEGDSSKNIIVVEDPYGGDPLRFPLCREFKQILESPENTGYLMTFEEYKQFKKNIPQPSPDHYLLEIRKRWKPVFILDSFKNFKQPKWLPVEDKEAHEQFETFITKQKNSEQFSLTYGKDYTLNKTFMDIDRDGVADTLYRQVGGDNYLMVGKGNDSLHERFRPKDRAQVFYYKGKPYFANVSLTQISIEEPKSVRNFKDFYAENICNFSTERK